MKIINELINSFFRHTPKDQLTEDEIEKIKQNGLIHFTYRYNVESILKEGVKGGLVSPMNKKEKDYAWFYIYDEKEFEEKKQIVQSKGHRSEYNAYIIIKDISQSQIDKLIMRRDNDCAVVIPEKLYTKSMKAYETEAKR